MNSLIRGGNSAANAQIIREVLSNERRDEARVLVVINAAAALFVGGKANDLKEATKLAENSLDSGAAASKLKQLIESTNRN